MTKCSYELQPSVAAEAEQKWCSFPGAGRFTRFFAASAGFVDGKLFRAFHRSLLCLIGQQLFGLGARADNFKIASARLAEAVRERE